jgi:hypothetical protein
MPTGDPGTGGGGASAAGAAGHTPLASAYHAFVTRPWTMRKMADEFAQLLGMAPAGVDGGNLTFRTGRPALHPLDLERPLRPGSFRLDGRHLRHRPPRPDEQLRRNGRPDRPPRAIRRGEPNQHPPGCLLPLAGEWEPSGEGGHCRRH